MESFEKAFDYLERIKYEIKFKNRFFIDSSFCDYIKEYAQDEFNKKLFIPNQDYFYRARLYIENDQYQKSRNPPPGPFIGYDEENSFVNLRVPAEGRGNPIFIPYLYVSTMIEGAIIETRPCANTLVSVAQIDLLEPLKILDFAHTSGTGDSAFKAELFMYINNEFNSPNYQPASGYLLTQYICEYAKKLGFDGVRYYSAFSDPVRAYLDTNKPYDNLVIFNYHKCKAINSKLYLVSKVIPQISEISK